jgi:hypothetical protein
MKVYVRLCVCEHARVCAPNFPSVPAGALHKYLITTIDEGVCVFVRVRVCAPFFPYIPANALRVHLITTIDEGVCVSHFSFCPCRCIARIPGHNHR